MACCFDLCETVEVRPLDEILASLPLTASVPVFVKMDIEGGECAAFASGQSLFTRVRPTLILYEGFRPHVKKCMTAEAERHGYTIGMKRGPDTNTVMWSGSQWPERHTSRFSSSE